MLDIDYLQDLILCRCSNSLHAQGLWKILMKLRDFNNTEVYENRSVELRHSSSRNGLSKTNKGLKAIHLKARMHSDLKT